MQLRAELVIRPNAPDRRRTITFHGLGVSRRSRYSTIGIRALQERVRDVNAVLEIADHTANGRRTICRDGIKRSIYRIRMTFCLGGRSTEDFVYVIPDHVHLEVGTKVGTELNLLEPLWEVSSDSADSEAEEYMLEYSFPPGVAPTLPAFRTPSNVHAEAADVIESLLAANVLEVSGTTADEPPRTRPTSPSTP